MAWGDEPTAENPFGQLAKLAMGPAAAGSHEAVTKNDEETRRLIDQLRQARNLDVKQLIRLYVLSKQFERWRPHLDNYREPLAVDWFARNLYYAKALSDFYSVYYSTPQARLDQEKALAVLARTQVNRSRAIQKISDTLQSGAPRAAERALEKLLDDLYAVTAVLSPEQRKPTYDSIATIAGRVQAAMEDLRKQEALAAETAERAKLTDMSSDLLGQLAIGSGPQRLAELIELWKGVHLQQLKVFAFTNASVPSGLSMGTDRERDYLSTEAMTASFTQELKAAVLDYVRRDAAAADAQSAEQLLHAYHQLLAELSMRTDDEPWLVGFDQPLEQLARTAGLTDLVGDYRRATDDLLRWRARCAEEWAACMPERSLLELARQELACGDTFLGLYTTGQAESRLPRLHGPIPDLVPLVAAKLVGASVRIARLVPLDGSARLWMGSLQEGWYCKIGEAANHAEYVQSLSAELLCDATHPPLSRQAAAALLAAQRGVCEEVGGQMTGFTLESYVTRLAKMPPVASNLLPLGSLGPDDLQSTPKSAVAVRGELTPRWFRYRHGFSVGQRLF